MSSHFTVVYDACVLYPAPLRDFLMRLALTDLFRARWSALIHEEWIKTLLASRPDLKHEDIERTRDLMNTAVRDCLVTGFEQLIPSVVLPDPDDRHVVAAAVHSGASLIVTFNLKDFPPDILKGIISQRSIRTISSSTYSTSTRRWSARRQRTIGEKPAQDRRRISGHAHQARVERRKPVRHHSATTG